MSAAGWEKQQKLDQTIQECRKLAPGCVVRENTDDWEGPSYDFFLSAVDEQNNTVYLNSKDDPTMRPVWEKALDKLRKDPLIKTNRSTSISSDPDHLKVLETLSKDYTNETQRGDVSASEYRVRSIYPKALCGHSFELDMMAIYKNGTKCTSDRIGFGETEARAWANAAANLPKPIEEISEENKCKTCGGSGKLESESSMNTRSRPCPDCKPVVFDDRLIPIPHFHTDSPIKAILEQPIVNRGRVAALASTQHAGDHYKSLAIEPAEYCHKNKFHFCESEAIKYLSRFRKKKGAEDLKKAHHFISMLLEMEYSIVSTIEYTEKEQQNAQ